MIGRITLFIITLMILMTILINIVTVVNRSIIDCRIYDLIGIYTEKISMEGVISSRDYTMIQSRLQSLGGFELEIKYSRRIAQDLYEITTRNEMILDRYFGKGDIINILVSKHNRLLFNRIAYVMVKGQEYYMGYEVIKEIQNRSIPVMVRNINQISYLIYDDILNPYYGDDEIEMPFNEGYIFEYSRYIKREEFNDGELAAISFTEN